MLLSRTFLRPATLCRLAPLPLARACSATVKSAPPQPPAEEEAAASKPDPANGGASTGGGATQSQTSTGSGPSDADLRLRVLEAALLEVPALGWTTQALTAGATACELSPMAHGLLPRGPIELVEHFSSSCDLRLGAELAERTEELRELHVHNRLLVAMQTRLRMIVPYKVSWPQALALRTLPANLPSTLRHGHALASQLLDACGEDAKQPLTPVTIDPMVKVVSIAAVYGAAELHLLTDTSPDHADTWNFVEREVEALRTMANAKSALSGLSPTSLIFSLLARK